MPSDKSIASDSLRNLALIGTMVAVGLGLLDASLTWLVGTSPGLRFPLDWASAKRGAGALAFLEQSFRKDATLARGATVVVGASSVMAGVDADVTMANDPDRALWIACGVQGTRIASLEPVLATAAAMHPAPQRVVVGINPLQFSRDPHERIFEDSPFEGKSGWLRQHSWLLTARTCGNAPQAIASLRARLWLTALTDAGLATVFPPVENPFVPPQAVRERPARAPIAYEEKRHFDKYRASIQADVIVPLTMENRHVALFARLCNRIAEKSELTVILMPESGVMRESEHPQFISQLQAFLPVGTRVLDLRHWGDERLFYDPVHLNLEGMAAFSSALPALLTSPRPPSP